MKTKNIQNLKKLLKPILYVFIIFHFSLFLTLSLSMCTFKSFSQGVAINVTGSSADNSAMLDVSGNYQGVLINRMTTLQRDSIAIKCSCSPAQALQIFNTTTNCLEIYYGTTWQPVMCPCTNAPAVAGTISGTATVCPGQNAVLYSVPAISGATNYIWSYSGTGAYIVGATNAVIVYFSGTATSGNLTVKGTNACGNGTVSSDYAIAVNSTAPNITIQPTSVNTCLGSGSESFSVTASGGLTYQWQEFIISWNNLSNAGIYSNVNTATLTISNPTVGMNNNKYRCIVSGTCTSTTTDGQATLTVYPVSTGGTATATASNVCSGNNTTITLAGSTGSIQWQQSENGTSSWTNVSGGSGSTTTTYTTSNLTSSKYYRAEVTNGVCSSDYSTTALVTVDPVSTGGTATATAPNVCSGNNTAITLTGSTGTIQWQQSANGSSGWANVSEGSGGTNLTYTTPNLTSTTYYRAQLISGVCTLDYSTTASVTVNPVSLGGTASATTSTLCSGRNTTITLTGATGTIQWQQSANGTSGWASVSGGSGGTTSTYTTPKLLLTTYYRAQVSSGVCTPDYSTTSLVTVIPFAVGGTISYTDASGLNPRSSPAYPDGFTIHTFTTGGSFQPNCTANVELLVVAGGGGGGGGTYGGHTGGGGGAGGLITNSSFAVGIQTYNVTIGGGGSGSTGAAGSIGGTGGNSVFSNLTALGGGGGGPTLSGNGGNGGSGGGGSRDNNSNSGGSGLQPGSASGGLGNAGGHTGPVNTGAAGGGGSGGVGQTGDAGGLGGAGTSSSISGSSVTYAAGGNAGSNDVPAANTGNGGGGGTGDGGAGNGKSGATGVVIIRYPN